MAAIDSLIEQVEDEALRTRLRDEVHRLAKQKKFGLVFEEHLPELTPIYNSKVCEGCLVALRGCTLADTWHVVSVRNGKASCIKSSTREHREFPVNDLVVVRQFGDPIFPSLVPMARVQNGDAGTPWHILIEADNYHALQLLEYCYAGQVDCIYIDPPYNTGARDWKYNNDYVDTNDRWRHSKWLAMMNRRLVLAKRLLAYDGVLIVTIDDNELYHLGCLLNDLFREYSQFIVGIEHNKRGRRGKNFAKSNEFAIFLVRNSLEVIAEDYSFGGLGGEERNLRRTGSGSLRHERPRKFFPIYIDQDSQTVLWAGDPLPEGEPRWNTIPNEIKAKFPGTNIAIVWPVDENGDEKNWHYGVERTRREIDDARLRVKRQEYGFQVYYRLREKESKKYKTIWTGPKFDASTYGTELVETILRKTNPFDYPKSLYAVAECLKAATLHKEDALILDFFAGSGTTLHAVDLLNAADGGKRRCILVTNNEVSESEANNLSARGLRPGHPEWEKHGICQSVTWPRIKYAILGRRDDGTELEGEYVLGKTAVKIKPRNFKQIGFIDPVTLNTANKKKQLVALIDSIPQSLVRPDTAFIVSDRHTASILFDPDRAEDWLAALEDKDHITDFFIVAPSPSVFEDLKTRVADLLGPITVPEEEKRLMRDGFPANVEYFKLDFLEKDQVALGRQFREILPILWMRAGALGPRPELPENAAIPDMLIPEHNPFAVLIDETRFSAFLRALEQRTDITHVFIVTDSDDDFPDMAAQVNAPQVIQLYRDYLENFMINKGGKA